MAPATGSASLATVTSSTTQVAVPFDLTTTYTAPTQCAQSVGALTMLELDQYRVWLNAILPVPGTTITSCFPSQYVSSFLLQTGGVSQVAMSPLVCPAGYTTQGPFTSNYIACCPSGWDGLYLSPGAPSDRPAFGASCYTNIYNVPVPVSFYDSTAFKATSIYTATQTNAQAFAYPYEGYALGVAILKSTTGPKEATASSKSSASSTPSPRITKPHTLSSGAKAGIAIASIAFFAFLLLAGILILRHRRKSRSSARVYNDRPTTQDPSGSCHSVEPKRDIIPEELYGSQEVKNHGETQELDTSRTVYELGGGRDYAPSTMSGENNSRGHGLSSPLSGRETPSNKGVVGPYEVD